MRTLRGRLVALGAVIALLLTAFVVVLVRSRTADCGTVVDRPALPAALLALGDFNQPYDSTQPRVIEDAAERAASAQFSSLLGTSPEAPVTVVGTGTAPDMLVVPLRAPASAAASASPAIVGLVVFARDCAGNAYFQATENDAALQPPLTSFPPVGRSIAVATLGSSSVRLQYTTSPLHPQWALTTSPSESLAAR